MRKLLMTILVICLIAGITACGEKNESANTVSGGWEINGITSQKTLPEDIQKAFEKATADESEYTLEPVAYIGTQVVAGRNHMILCRAKTSDDPDGTYKVAVIYEDLEGNAELTSLGDFTLEDYIEGEGAASGKQLSGGWYVPDSDVTADIPEEVQEAYNEATATVDWEWSEVAPLAYIGNQIVSGTNFALLCRGDYNSDEKASELMVIVVYEGIDGNSEISNIHRIDITSLTEQSTKKPDVKRTIEGNMKTYYELSDGTWKCEDYLYKYRLEINGRMPNAAVDSTFVYLSNIEEISFNQAYKAAGVSSDSNDYFAPEEAVLVDMK